MEQNFTDEPFEPVEKLVSSYIPCSFPGCLQVVNVNKERRKKLNKPKKVTVLCQRHRQRTYKKKYMNQKLHMRTQYKDSEKFFSGSPIPMDGQKLSDMLRQVLMQKRLEMLKSPAIVEFLKQHQNSVKEKAIKKVQLKNSSAKDKQDVKSSSTLPEQDGNQDKIENFGSEALDDSTSLLKPDFSFTNNCIAYQYQDNAPQQVQQRSEDDCIDQHKSSSLSPVKTEDTEQLVPTSAGTTTTSSSPLATETNIVSSIENDQSSYFQEPLSFDVPSVECQPVTQLSLTAGDIEHFTPTFSQNGQNTETVAEVNPGFNQTRLFHVPEVQTVPAVLTGNGVIGNLSASMIAQDPNLNASLTERKSAFYQTGAGGAQSLLAIRAVALAGNSNVPTVFLSV